MPEVPDHLFPRAALTNSYIRFAGLDAEGDGARVRFNIYDEERSFVATLVTEVGPQPSGTIDAIVVEGHRRLTQMLRQWLYEADQDRQAFERQALPPAP